MCNTPIGTTSQSMVMTTFATTYTSYLQTVDRLRKASKSEILKMSILTSNFDGLWHIFPNFA